jgi:hypothetical protein
MPKPPARARFQFHLSTAIGLMFTAGALIWANLCGHGWPMRVDLELYGSSTFFMTISLARILFGMLIDAATAIIIVFPIWYAMEGIYSRIHSSPKEQ